jgi:hypothetical protein
VGSCSNFSKIDLRSDSNRRNKYSASKNSQGLGSNDSLTNIPEEEKEKRKTNVPFPDNNFIGVHDSGSAHAKFSKKPSHENL